jgi:hypothetical protein
VPNMMSRTQRKTNFEKNMIAQIERASPTTLVLPGR